MVAIALLMVVGIIMAGWSSNNKYATLGAMRSAAQAVSYEVPLVLSLLGPVMLAGTMSMGQLVEAQGGTWFGFLPCWSSGLSPGRSVPGLFHVRAGLV